MRLGEVLAHVVERFGDADARDDILALCVDEEVAVAHLLAGRGVAGECHSGAGIVALVAEHHRLDVDGRAEIVGDVLHLAVVAGTPAVPRTEHGLDRVPQLLDRVGGERDARLGLHDSLERLDQTLEVFRRELGFVLHVLRDDQVVQGLLEHLA